jgi:hypothetical protein
MARVGGKQNGARRFVGGGPRPDLRALRQKEAEERQTERDVLLPQAQLKRLDALLGAGVGAVKERARLLWQVKTGRKAPAFEKEQARLLAAEKEQARLAVVLAAEAEKARRLVAAEAHLVALNALEAAEPAVPDASGPKAR